MIVLEIIFQSASILLGFLAVCILYWVNPDASHSKRVLILLLSVVTLMNINAALFLSGWYLKFPQFHKILYPFSLLIAPLSYIYIRSVLRQEFKFNKYDWLVLLPSLVLAISLIPYYTMPLVEKRAYFTQFYHDITFRLKSNNGLLPGYSFPIFRSIWSLLFIILNFRLILRFTRKATPKILTDNITALRWVKTLNFTLALLMAAYLFVSVIAPIAKTDFHIPDIAIGSLALVMCIALFTRPKILYGLYIPTLSQTLPEQNGLTNTTFNAALPANPLINENKETGSENTIRVSSSDAYNYKLLVENFFNINKPYLKAEYTLDQLVTDLKVPRYTLSAFINREYNMGFREFLNRYRVEYMITNLNKPEWEQFTLEAIAEECGFNSRTTFIKNFKEITGLTPSAYVKGHSKD
jgi:AraC-like DNA-binding protein